MRLTLGALSGKEKQYELSHFRPHGNESQRDRTGQRGLCGPGGADLPGDFDAAIKLGVNYFDLYNPEPYVRDAFGKAMAGRREKFILQGHLCAAWVDGQYKRTRDIEEVKAAYDDLFRRLGTDYIDVGMIHYVDEQVDFNEVFGGPVMQFAKELKAQGKIRAIGMSTHNPGWPFLPPSPGWWT